MQSYKINSKNHYICSIPKNIKNMKRLILFVLGILFLCAEASAGSTLFYRIRLDSDIDKSSRRLVTVGLAKAGDAGADYIILDLNTYGGAVDAADSIRSAILRCKIPVLAFIDLQAASAGALISIACDSIYMKTGSSIGAATVVNQTGEVMPDKYQSFMRGMMRSTAQANGRDPGIAEAMVDSAKVLSLTPSEAVEAGYCEGIYESAEEVAAAVAGSAGYEIRNMDEDMTMLDRTVQFLLHPILQSIFIMMIIGGIYIEFHTPGIGLPLAIAIAGAVLYFSPLFIEEMAEYWELILFIVGLILIALEIFVIPGFGIAGISGIIAVVLSLAFAMIDNDVLRQGNGRFDFMPVVKSLGTVIISIFIAISCSIWLVRRLYPTRSFDHIVLRDSLAAEKGYSGVDSELERYVGERVRVFSDMRPSGKVLTSDGRIHEASMIFGSAAKNETVEIKKAEQGRLYCEK